MNRRQQVESMLYAERIARITVLGLLVGAAFDESINRGVIWVAIFLLVLSEVALVAHRHYREREGSS